MGIFGRKTKLPGKDGNDIIEEQIKEFLECLKQDLTLGLASFYMGNGNKGTNDKTFMANSKTNASKASILGDKNSIYSLLSDIKDAFDMSKAKKNSVFYQILLKLKNIEKATESDKGAKIERKIDIVINGIDSDVIQSLMDLSKIEADKNSTAIYNILSLLKPLSEIDGNKLSAGIDALNENIPKLSATLDSLNEVYSKLGTQYQSIISLAAMSGQVRTATDQIRDTIAETEDVAIDASSRKKEVAEANITIQGLGSFVMAAAFVMSIGALFVMLGGGKFILSALAFGATLALFEAMVLAPILIVKNVSEEIFQGLKDFTAFVITCTTIMLIGALFMGLSGGKLVLNALKFGFVLMVFEALVVAPLLLFSDIKTELFEGLKNFSTFLITCTTIMLIGALFMALSGGKLVINALKFGFVLMAFEALVIAPFLLFNLVNSEIFKGLKSFSTVIITCTVVLLVGALFMGLSGGKMVKNALEFGKLLMKFEVMVVAPFLLFSLISGQAMNSLANFSAFLIVCTTILMVGALFMSLKGGKMPQYALDFTKILGLFIAGIELAVLPMMLFFRPSVMNKMKDFSIFIGICTACLVLGAWFIQKYGTDSIISYGKILTLFIGSMSLIASKIAKDFNKKQLDSLKPFSIFVGTLHAILLTGALYVEKYGASEALKYAGVFDLFVMSMGKVSKKIIEEFDNTSLKSLTSFSKFLGALHIILTTGSVFVDKYGTAAALKYASVITGFVYMMIPALSAVMAIQTVNKIALMTKITNPTALMSFKGNGMMGFLFFVGAMHFVLLSGAEFVSKYGTKPVGEYGIMISVFIGAMVLAIKGIQYVMDGKAMAKLTDFNIFVGVLHAVLLTGAMFVAEYGTGPVAEYGLMISAFCGIMTGIIWAIGKAMGAKEVLALNEFSIFVGVLHAVLITGSLFVTEHGTEKIVTYGLCISLFTLGMVGVFALMGDNIATIERGGLAIASMALGLLALGASIEFVLRLWTDHSIGDITAAFATIGLASVEFGILFGAWGEPALAKNVALGSAVMVAVSAALGIYGFVINLILDMLKDNDDVLGRMSALCLIAGEFSLLFGILGAAGWTVPIGAAVIVAISAAIGIYGTVLAYVCDLMKQYPYEVIGEAILKLEASAGLFSAFFAVIGIPAFALLISLGATAINSMSLALQQYGIALDIAGDVYKRHKDVIIPATDLMKDAMDRIEDLFSSLGVSVWARFGAVTATKLSDATSKLVESLNILSTVYKSNNDGKDIIEAVVTISKLIQEQLVPMYEDIADLNIIGTKFNLWVMTGMSNDIEEIIDDILQSVQKISKTGNIESKLDLIYTNINKYFSIPDQIADNWWNLFWKTPKIKRMRRLSDEIAQVLSNVAEGVYSVANLQIPNQWDEKGNPIHFRQLRERDFDLASENVGAVLSTMATALNTVHDKMVEDGLLSSTFTFLLTGYEGPIGRVLWVSNQIATVVGNVGESIGNIAKLQIPIEFDPKTGKPINFRTLKKKDFEDMSAGINTVLTSIIGALSELYANGANLTDANGNKIDTGGKNVFDKVETGWFSEDEPSPIEKVLTASFQIGELIANIGEGVGKIAKMQIPIAWDSKTGKVTQYRTLKEKDFTDMGTGIRRILTAVLESLITIAKDNKDLFEQASAGFLGLGGKKDSPIQQAVGCSFQISEMISKVGTGISKIAGMQIPDQWDEKGNPIHYVQLEQQDLIDAGDAVGEIVTCLAQKLIDLYNKPENKELFEDDVLKNVIESVKPVSELVANMAEGLVKIASSQIPDQWDKDGKAIHYIQLDKEDFKKAGENVAVITTTLAQALIDTAKQNPEFFFDCTVGKDGKVTVDYSSSNEAFQNIVGSFSAMGSLLSGISDSLIKLGQGLVADQWDENGNPKHFKQIDFNKVIPDMKRIIEEILTSLANTTIQIYNEHKTDVFDENSTFAEAIQAVNGTVEMMSKMADTVVKIASATIPDKWDEHGKPIHFTKINVEDAVYKSNYLFSQIMGGMICTIGLLTQGELKYHDLNSDTWYILPNPTSDVWVQKVESIREVTQNIVEMVSKCAKMTLDMASMKVATKFDDKGNATGYVKLGPKEIAEAHENMKLILVSMTSVLEDEEIKKRFGDKYARWGKIAAAENMAEATSEITTSLSNIIMDINRLLSQQDTVKKIFDYTSKESMIKNMPAGITMPFFKDIFALLMNMGEIINSFSDALVGGMDEEAVGKGTLIINSKLKELLEKNAIQKDLDNVLGLISSILSTVAGFDESLFTNKNISGFMRRDETGQYIIIELINSILNVYKNILNSFNQAETGFALDGSPFKNMSFYLMSIDRANDAVMKLVEMSSILNGVSGMSLNNDILDKVNQLKDFYSSLFETLSRLNIPDSGKTNLYWVTSDLQRFISIISLFNTSANVKSEKLKSSILDIYQAMSNQKQSKIFAANSMILSSYVKTINSVNVNSTNALTALVRELNILGVRLGNIDRLTDALANKLAEVLKHLVEKLEESKEAIDKADEIQSKRHQLINDSVEKISEMLGMPLQVNIKPDMPNPDDTTTTPPAST